MKSIHEMNYLCKLRDTHIISRYDQCLNYWTDRERERNYKYWFVMEVRRRQKNYVHWSVTDGKLYMLEVTEQSNCGAYLKFWMTG